MKLVIQFTIFLALLVSGIYLGSQNATEIDVVFFGRTFEDKPLWMIMVLSFAVGAAVSLIFCSFEMLRSWHRIFQLKRQLKSQDRGELSDSFNEGEVQLPPVGEPSERTSTQPEPEKNA